jgi:prepilin-type processing-associated H-X9-DG protein
VFIKSRVHIRRLASRIVFIDVGQIIPETYAVYYNQQKWWDQPPVRHDDGTTLSFADGHAEYRKWKGAETIDRAKAAKSIYNPNATDHWSPNTQPGIEDLHQIQISTWGQLGH